MCNVDGRYEYSLSFFSWSLCRPHMTQFRKLREMAHEEKLVPIEIEPGPGETFALVGPAREARQCG